MTGEQFPEEFLRGISNIDFVKDGQVLPSAFQFDDADRDDGKMEASINWLDDEGAIAVALNQTKDNGKIQFPGGVARIEVAFAKQILRNFSQKEFSYERAPLKNNKYHGNLLLASSLHKQRRHMLMTGLALAAGTNIITKQDEI